MDLFNTKKIEALNKTVDYLCDKVAILISESVALQTIAFEQYKKSNKPKFKVGDNVELRIPFADSYIRYEGVIYCVSVDVNNSAIGYIYYVSCSRELKKSDGSNLFKIKK